MLGWADWREVNAGNKVNRDWRREKRKGKTVSLYSRKKYAIYVIIIVTVQSKLWLWSLVNEKCDYGSKSWISIFGIFRLLGL